jgi:hypothetical protein
VGYGELSHLITCARRETKKGLYRIDRPMIEANLPEKTEILDGKSIDSVRDAYQSRADHSKDGD